ncbi:uncharacterized protein [Asterias amurensis]|uniref:uncharacterized protein n=1 Tax=Asterias amurensis TaxID=7602 RepID=UPI003AB40CE6
MAGYDTSPVCNNGFSARLMTGKGPNIIPGSLGPKSPRKLHGIGKSLEQHMEDEETMNANLKQSKPTTSPPSKTFHFKDTGSLWKSVQDCHASLNVANPRHFEFAVANLCFLLKASGKELDKHVKTEIDRIFQTIRILALDPKKRPTTRMQLLKVIELRARHWDVEQRTDKQKTASIHTSDTGTSKTVVSSTEIKATVEKSHTECAQSKLACNVDIRTELHSTDRKTDTKPLLQPVAKTQSHPMLQPDVKPLHHLGAKPRSQPLLQPGAKPLNQPAPSHKTTQSPPKTCDGFKLDSPSSTGFWDAVTYSPDVTRPLPVIHEESPDATSHCRVEAGGDCTYLTLSPTEREKQDCLALPSGDEDGNQFEDASSPVKASIKSTLFRTISPVDTVSARTRHLSGGSSSSRSPVVHQYTRDFLLKCWSSPLCRVMPAALQHTIPHSDIHYIVRIPTFEDPTFLLMDKTPPPNLKSASISSYFNRRRHPTWPSNTN